MIAPPPGGLLAVDKPEGWTSHDVVAVLRGLFGLRRVGHGGTLDPLATGVLVILAGAATRQLDRIHGTAKAYGALVRFGEETTTDDREGPVTRAAPVPLLDAAALDSALAPFRGPIVQVPPDYAAVKVGGKPAYARARAGETLELAPRTVTI
ncbi:MAG: tRNA pseudouridine(55) synthase TruB, partial [Candidatus Limnocylindria bacterium]|nr:tRNA pseudouridine(55) synthase TruB [Candidatus Limnocylindria bacterium]